MVRKILVLADDLTRATDCAAVCVLAGVPTKVVTDTAFLQPGRGVIVVNTETRHAPPRVAARRVATVVRWAQRHGVRHLFKKTDSTLRGNIGAELAALPVPMSFVPAYPEDGRFTRDGYHYVGDKLVHETEFGHDPRHPVTESHVLTLLGHPPVVAVLDTATPADVKKLARRIHKQVVAGRAGVLRALRCRVLVPVVEVEPAAILSRAPGLPQLTAVLTKSGGFGSESIADKIHQ